MEVLQPTLAASLVVVLYLMIDKIIVPLVKGKANGNGRNATDDKHQDYITRTVEYRLNDHEKRLGSHTDALAEIGAAVQVIKAVVQRIEEKTTCYGGYGRA